MLHMYCAVHYLTIPPCSDGHDTDAVYESDWLTWWLMPLLQDPNFNTDRTLILLTFDECVVY